MILQNCFRGDLCRFRKLVKNSFLYAEGDEFRKQTRNQLHFLFEPIAGAAPHNTAMAP
jgi:hypothetical protein